SSRPPQTPGASRHEVVRRPNAFAPISSHADLAQPDKKAPELPLRGCSMQLIGRRSEVPVDAEAAGEAVAAPVPIARHEEFVRLAVVVDGSKEPARGRLVCAWIHQIEVE